MYVRMLVLPSVRISFALYDADIKVKEPDFEAMCRGRKAYLPPRFMTVNTALEQLLLLEGRRSEGSKKGFAELLR